MIYTKCDQCEREIKLVDIIEVEYNFHVCEDCYINICVSEFERRADEEAR